MGQLSPTLLLCFSHFFSTWGDRMWMFAIGLYLIQLTPTSLQLAAVYGLVVTITVVVFGPVVGEWVDNNGRIKVVRISLALQNILVIAAAQVIVVIIFVDLNQTWLLVCQAAIIVLGALANLASKATQISIERDWIVVMAHGDKDLLAGTNAKMRRIDLSCAILAPVAVGLIMTFISRLGGIIFICAWNVVSVIAEYRLLAVVYARVPPLAVKGETIVVDKLEDDEADPSTTNGTSHKMPTAEVVAPPASSGLNLLGRFRSFFAGWPLYAKQKIALAGMSLALLYLTVLGFSAITTGYAYTQKLSEAVVSACYGIGSFVGIIGTFLFPRIRRRVGLASTGLVSFFLQLSALSLCVVSIWLPGSPSSLRSNPYVADACFASTNTSSGRAPAPTPITTTLFATTIFPTTVFHITMFPAAPVTDANANGTNVTTTSRPVVYLSNVTTRNVLRQGNGTFFLPQSPCKNQEFSYISIAMLMAGLVLSRAGLWMTDLTVTQLIQENVAPTERGVISGTQNSFNSILDLVHYVATIILHRPQDFGYLTLMSFTAISVGYIVYVVFYVRFSRNLAIEKRKESTGEELLPPAEA